MKDHLRFGIAYWHTMRGTGNDPFGGTAVRPWEAANDDVANAQNRARVFIEFMEKLGAPFIASTIAISHPRAPHCRRAMKTSTPWFPFLRRSRNVPVSSCCGAQPISATRVSCTARRPAATPMSLPTRRVR